MTKKRRNRKSDPRPDARELGGESEDSLRRAGVDPHERELEADHDRAHDAGLEAGPEDREDLAADPNDLGRRFLEDATQQPRRERDSAEIEREGTGDEPLVTMGEQHVRDLVPDATDDTDPLTTDAPDLTEHEERISDKTREMQKERRLEQRRDSTV